VPLSDDEVAAAVQGEQAALRVVYERLAPALVGYLRVRGSDDPEALAQDVFVALLPRLPRLKGGSSGLRTLAFSIAHARLVDELRQRARRDRTTSYEPDSDPRVSDSAESAALVEIETAGVVDLLRGLDDSQRSVVALRVVAQLSLEETAAVVGKSVGAVKQLQRRGLLALRARVTAREGVTL
jgi:RNA polymerase sigma-70 factor (ECF subfamily)